MRGLREQRNGGRTEGNREENKEGYAFGMAELKNITTAFSIFSVSVQTKDDMHVEHHLINPSSLHRCIRCD